MQAIVRIFTKPDTVISLKNLRLSSILVSIYQIIIASVALFMSLLGLAHAKEMKKMLAADIADQDDLGLYYEKNPYKNQMSLFNASTLASLTELILYVVTALAFVYFLTCIGLLVGVFKKRTFLIIPWLIVYFFGIVITVLFMFQNINSSIQKFTNGIWHFWLLCTGITMFDIMLWYVIYSYLLSLREKCQTIKTKSIESAYLSGSTKNLHKENLHLSINGYKHYLYFPDAENQKI